MTQQNQTPIYKKWWFWLIIIVVIIGVGAVAAGGNKGNEAEKIGEGSNGTTSNSSNAAGAQTTFKVGDLISYDNKEITVSDVVRNYSTDSQYITPSDGKEYVKVTISITNKSDSKTNYNALDWKMEDSTGDIQSCAVMASPDDALNSGDLAAGGTKTGSIVYEVPAGDAGLKLHYQPNVFLDSKEIVIEL